MESAPRGAPLLQRVCYQTTRMLAVLPVRGTQATNRIYSLATKSHIYARWYTSMQRMHSLCLRAPSCSSHESTPGPLAPARNPPATRSNPRGRSPGNSKNTTRKTYFHGSRKIQNGCCPLIEPAACCRAQHGDATTVHIHLPVLREVRAKLCGNWARQSPPQWWLRQTISRCQWRARRSDTRPRVFNMRHCGALNKRFWPNSNNASQTQRTAVSNKPLARA